MPCPFRGASEDTGHEAPDRWTGVDRREFLKSALAIGGMGSLSACLDREGPLDVSRGPEDPSSLPERQFAWNDHLPEGPHQNVKIPNHQLLLFLDCVDDGAPSSADREQLETALRSIERAVHWGTGDEFNPGSTTGLLHLIGYSPSYFERFEASLPERIDLRRPERMITNLDESATPDPYDAVLALTSDKVRVLLAAEQALRGNLNTLNGIPVEATFDGVFRIADRRTGFVGVGRPADELDVDGIPEHAPMSMGYRSGFKDNQARETRVALLRGPFQDGTTMQISRLGLDLDAWYDLNENKRVERMFSPEHDPEDVGEIGEGLAGQSRITQGDVNDAESHARRREIVGHTQKVAAARNDGFEPTLLRRSEGVSTDLDQPAMNFLSLQRRMEAFLNVRRAMNGHHIETDVPEDNDGIRGFVDVLRRGTYLVPPRSQRSLPRPNPGAN